MVRQCHVCSDISIDSASTAADVSICAIINKPANFNHQNVTVKGTAAGLRKGASRDGGAYMTLSLQEPQRVRWRHHFCSRRF